jgi:hypothetical protein
MYNVKNLLKKANSLKSKKKSYNVPFIPPIGTVFELCDDCENLKENCKYKSHSSTQHICLGYQTYNSDGDEGRIDSRPSPDSTMITMPVNEYHSLLNFLNRNYEVYTNRQLDIPESCYYLSLSKSRKIKYSI